MTYYKIKAVRKSEKEYKELSYNERRALGAELAEKSESLFQKHGGNDLIVTSSIGDKETILVAVSSNGDDIDYLISKYIKLLPFKIEDYKKEEITFSSFFALLNASDRNGFIDDAEDVLDDLNIGALHQYNGRVEFGEGILDDKITQDKAKTICEEMLFEATLGNEIDRIFSIDANCRAQGHPVHYILNVNSKETRKTICRTLLSSLYKMGRIKNRRYSFVDYNSDSNFPGKSYETLYKSSEGGAVVIRYNEEEGVGGEFARRGADIIAALATVANQYKHKVLTVIALPHNAKKAKEEFLRYFGSTSFIELYEDVVFGEKAINHLKALAKKNKIRADKKLTSKITDEDKGYTAEDLNKIFEMWFDKKLRNEIYPEYKTAQTVKAKLKKEKPKGGAYDRLQNLIGLNSAKTVMENALNYFKMQKLFADRGMVADHPSMHMVFTGNPGTAKTTVARLFARIMKENGLLTKGGIFEVGRADLVGQYVGSTAPLVKNAFRRAKGGVLFIDEAYSLVDDRSGLYGDEAINTIVQEMENNRHDTIVIFAGYPDKMEGFLNKNPGLRSRIAFHIPFEDYSVDELCDIAELIAKDSKLVLSADAKQKLVGVFNTAKQKNDFGNGRYARNIIEKAKMAQANRLAKFDVDEITDDDLKTIMSDDIIVLNEEHKKEKIKIGFSA